jgi:hypothetical protein
MYDDGCNAERFRAVAEHRVAGLFFTLAVPFDNAGNGGHSEVHIACPGADSGCSGLISEPATVRAPAPEKPW